MAISNWQLAKPTPKTFNHKGHPFDFAQGRLRNTKGISEIDKIAEVYANLGSLWDDLC